MADILNLSKSLRDVDFYYNINGEDYMRIALVENEQRLRQAIRNISRFIR